MAVEPGDKVVHGSDLTYITEQYKVYFQAKEAGKGLSTNDYTNEDKAKLAGIDTGAEVNVVKSVDTTEHNGTALSLSNAGSLSPSFNPSHAILDGYQLPTAASVVTATDTITQAFGKLQKSKAPLSSPAFTGTPTAPTAATGTNTRQVATTEFVNDSIDACKGFYVASDMLAYAPSNTKNTYFGLEADDGTVQIKSLTKVEKTYEGSTEKYDLITMKVSAPLVKQSETTNNNKFPLAIAGRMYNNLVSGNAYQTYYSQNIQANPSTGVLYANDLNVGGVSAIQTLIASNPYIVGTQASATNLWTGVAPFATLQVGQAIRYKLPYAGNSSAATLELTLADGVSTTGAIAVKMNASTDITTQYAANTVLYLTYDGTNWRHDGDYNTDTTYQLRSYYNHIPLSDRIGRYRLVFTSADGQTLVPANTSNSTSATAQKDVNQRPIDPFGPIYYYNASTIRDAGESVADATLYQQREACTLGYSFNRTGAALTLTANKPVYLVCAPQADGSAIMDEDNPIIQSLPSTDDGNIYIFLGQVYNATTISLDINHPVYYYKEGAIRLWTNAASSGGGSVTEVFTAEYGITSYAECETAYSAGKALFCLVDEDPDYYTLPMTYWDDNGGPHAAFTFIGAVSPEVFYKAVIDDTDTWDVSTFTFQTTSNLVTSISSTSTNYQYPSAKCMYDMIGDIETLLAAL